MATITQSPYYTLVSSTKHWAKYFMKQMTSSLCPISTQTFGYSYSYAPCTSYLPYIRMYHQYTNQFIMSFSRDIWNSTNYEQS